MREWQTRVPYFDKHGKRTPVVIGFEYVPDGGVRYKSVKPDLSRSPQVLMALGAERLSRLGRFVIWLNKK